MSQAGWLHMQNRYTAPVVKFFWIVAVHLVFQVSSQKEVTGVHVWRIGWLIHAASCMCGIVQSNHTIIEMFVREIKDVGRAMWPDTILHKP